MRYINFSYTAYTARGQGRARPRGGSHLADSTEVPGRASTWRKEGRARASTWRASDTTRAGQNTRARPRPARYPPGAGQFTRSTPPRARPPPCCAMGQARARSYPPGGSRFAHQPGQLVQLKKRAPSVAVHHLAGQSHHRAARAIARPPPLEVKKDFPPGAGKLPSERARPALPTEPGRQFTRAAASSHQEHTTTRPAYPPTIARKKSTEGQAARCSWYWRPGGLVSTR